MVCGSIGHGTAHAESRLAAEYQQGQDFKAFAVSVRENGQREGEAQGAAWGYDTAQEAVEAALAYCREKVQSGNRRGNCRVVMLGTIPIRDTSELPLAAERYEADVLQRLRQELERTGERDLVTRLSTIYQKIGRYAESEALLYDLAMSGEHLGQNALAYHWAELRKRLPEALALVESAISQDPGFFSYRDTKALVLARLGRLDEAVTSAKLAVDLEAHPIALDHYGDLLWLSGSEEEARQEWRRAVEASRNILFVQRVQDKIRHGMTGDIVFE